jgi:hypothetical protein
MRNNNFDEFKDDIELLSLQYTYNSLLLHIINYNYCIKNNNKTGAEHNCKQAMEIIDCHKERFEVVGITKHVKINGFLSIFNKCKPYMLHNLDDDVIQHFANKLLRDFLNSVVLV